jgi:hypothetical protein
MGLYATVKDALKATEGGHRTVRCSCGRIITTCRCAGPDKQIAVVAEGCGACKK